MFDETCENIKLNDNGDGNNIKVYIVESKFRNIPWFTYLSAFTASLTMVSIGSSFVWSSSVIPQLLLNDTEINPLETPVTTMQIAILTSTTYASTIIAYIFIAKISDLFGRKKMLISASLCMVAALFLLAFAKSIYIYYFCMFIEGFAYAISFINISIYNNEISENCNRGRIGCFMGLAMPTGMLWGYVFGPLTSIKIFTLICAIPSALSLVLFPFIVETPVYLTAVGKRGEALSSLRYLRKPRNESEIENEVEKIEESVKAASAINKIGMLDVVRDKTAVKAVFITVLLCIAMQLTGLAFIFPHTKSIFDQAGSNLSGDAVGILIGVVNESFSVIAAFFVDRVGRRPLILISGLGCSICMSLLGLSFYLKDFHISIFVHMRWFSVVCVIIFMIVYGLGLGPLPNAIMSEVFVPELRASGMAIALIVDSISFTIILFSYPLLAEAYGICVVMFAYSFGGLIMFLLLFFFLPETKGRTTTEIQESLKKSKFVN